MSSRPIAAKVSVKSLFPANWNATAAGDLSAIGSKAELSVIGEREERSKKTPLRVFLDQCFELDMGSRYGQDIGGAVDDKRRAGQFKQMEHQPSRPADACRYGLEGLRMKLPVVRGKIDRRILANYRIDPTVMSDVLPKPFRPQIVNGFAVGGICLIRLKEIRPHFFPFRWGIGSENAAHRIAVEWDVNGETREGVYIPRRDTGSLLNTLVGGRIFPGVHHHASFTVTESKDALSVDMNSDDGKTRVSLRGVVTENFPKTSVFSSLSAASDFFKRGSLGYSVTQVDGKYDGLELRCRDWRMESLEIDKIESSYFDDKSRFPADSILFDCALLMRSIEHEWHGREDLCCSTAKKPYQSDGPKRGIGRFLMGNLLAPARSSGTFGDDVSPRTNL